jgi:hypothetical protein
MGVYGCCEYSVVAMEVNGYYGMSMVAILVTGCTGRSVVAMEIN